MSIHAIPVSAIDSESVSPNLGKGPLIHVLCSIKKRNIKVRDY